MIDFNIIGMILLGLLSWSLMIVAIVALFMGAKKMNSQPRVIPSDNKDVKTNHHQNA